MRSSYDEGSKVALQAGVEIGLAIAAERQERIAGKSEMTREEIVKYLGTIGVPLPWLEALQVIGQARTMLMVDNVMLMSLQRRITELEAQAAAGSASSPQESQP